MSKYSNEVSHITIAGQDIINSFTFSELKWLGTYKWTILTSAVSDTLSFASWWRFDWDSKQPYVGRSEWISKVVPVDENYILYVPSVGCEHSCMSDMCTDVWHSSLPCQCASLCLGLMVEQLLHLFQLSNCSPKSYSALQKKFW